MTEEYTPTEARLRERVKGSLGEYAHEFGIDGEAAMDAWIDQALAERDNRVRAAERAKRPDRIEELEKNLSYEVEQKIKLADTLRAERAKRPDLPCDGGCNVNDGPMEECSHHGRTPRDLWGIIEDLIQRLATERAKRPDREHLAQMIAKHRIWSMSKQRVICACGWRGRRDVHELHAADAVLALEPEAREEPRTLDDGQQIDFEIAMDQHQPVISFRDGSIARCQCMDRVFYVKTESWGQHLAEVALAALPEAREATDAEQCMLVMRASWDTAGHQPLPRYVGPFPDPDAAFRWVRHHAPLSGEFNSSPWPVKPEEVSRG